MHLSKRIILLLEGTGNDSGFGDQDTNMCIRDIIARHFVRRRRVRSSGSSDSQDHG